MIAGLQRLLCRPNLRIKQLYQAAAVQPERGSSVCAGTCTLKLAPPAACCACQVQQCKRRRQGKRRGHSRHSVHPPAAHARALCGCPAATAAAAAVAPSGNGGSHTRPPDSATHARLGACKDTLASGWSGGARGRGHPRTAVLPCNSQLGAAPAGGLHRRQPHQGQCNDSALGLG